MGFGKRLESGISLGKGYPIGFWLSKPTESARGQAALENTEVNQMWSLPSVVHSLAGGGRKCRYFEEKKEYYKLDNIPILITYTQHIL